MNRLLLPLLASFLAAATASSADADPTRVLPPGKAPEDARIGKVRTLNEKDFFLVPPSTLQAWQERRQQVREQTLVSLGLWPLPPRTPLKPVIHGKIDRGDYTVEKVFFASLPGHYVSGNLYRPTKTGDRKLPGVLCPHGHWANGRFYEASEKEAQNQIKQKAETTLAGARYPLQARCAQLARMGCVVFHYDMVGYADSKEIAHRAGFTDAEAELRLQSFMGLQTWNSIRSLDFLLSLPNVDANRIGVTGASGGGTQTFILGAIDDRPAVAFPAVMVSTQMQGGCICENCSHLRVGTGNVELAALFAPKPLAMSGANDWTIDIEKKGLPELKEVYKLYGAEKKVAAKCHPEFGHNYNQVSRELMYNWFNDHLKLGLPSPVREQPFEPIAPKDLSVYDAEHPRPKDSVDADRLRQYLTEVSDKQVEALIPRDKKALAEFQHVVGTASRVMLHDTLPAKDGVEAKPMGETKADGLVWQRYLLSRKGAGEQVPALLVRGKGFDGTVVVWVAPEGKASLLADGKLTPAARKLLDAKTAILAVDVYGTGELKLEKPLPVDRNFAGYTFGYNRTLVAQRVHDILTAVAFARSQPDARRVSLLGAGKAGPWVLLARGLCGKGVERTAADMDGFRFEKVRGTDDEMMLPGALKYGGLPAFAALAAPGELFIHNNRGTGMGKWLKPAYKSAGAEEKLKTSGEKASPEAVAEWLVR